jgi:S1-C subfamily serine protease
MSRLRVAASLIAVAALVTGCGGMGEILQRFDRGTSTTMQTPEPAMSADAVVAKAQPSVVKVRSVAERCSKVLEGSGFVVAPNRVMTNAHVVAGAEMSSVDAGGKTYDAQVVSYDPQVDIAILDVPDLPAQPLKFAEYTAGAGTDVLVLGYPGAASFKASPAQIREVIELNGPDIYREATVTRQVYRLTGSFPQSGSSGSAVVDLNDQVLGVYFGAEVHDSTTGFAITAAQVAPQMSRTGDTEAVGTGACVT